jgi:hypothetical protein
VAGTVNELITALDGKAVDRMEHVSDEQYSSRYSGNL